MLDTVRWWGFFFFLRGNAGIRSNYVELPAVAKLRNTTMTIPTKKMSIFLCKCEAFPPPKKSHFPPLTF